MKVALVSEHANPLAALGGVDAGGQNVHVAELAKALAALGHDVTVYTRRDSATAPETVTTDAGFTVVHVPAGPPCSIPKDDMLPHMVQFGDFLADRWSVSRPDVAHAHFWMSGIATRRAAERLDIPHAITFHALGEVKRRYQGAADTSPRDRIPIERELACGAGRVIATCSDEAFELTRMGTDRARIAVVPCGVDLDMFGPTGPTLRRPTEQQYRVVTVGRMVRRKGFATAIGALAHIPDAELVVVGGPEAGQFEKDPEVVRLTRTAVRLGVRDRVRFVGQVSRENMPSLLRSADTVVCAPWYEPFGIVPLEAMACGVPVVASAVGGLLDTVVDGRTGTLVPPRDALSVANAVNRLLADHSLRQSCSAEAQQRAHRYSWSRIADDTVRVYSRILRTVSETTAVGESR
ncbi:glycosyltransferase [Rhodococcus sp. NPDC078407]|uniref:glycosyltransferase n=1 Tax=Rhodococcus sp. NPDC078407 TaxID=3364509 RepID=UPI0037C5941C